MAIIGILPRNLLFNTFAVTTPIFILPDVVLAMKSLRCILTFALFLAATAGCNQPVSDGGGCGTYNGHTLYKGSQGGCYYYNDQGNKTYVDRSYCNC